MKLAIRSLAVLAAASLVPSASAQAPSPGTLPDVKTRIQRIETGLIPHPGIMIKGRTAQKAALVERMKAYRVPGLSLVVINDCEIEWTEGYGVKNAGTSAAVGLGTLFQAASISKPVAAAAALSYVERGLLNLDEDVNRWLRSWKVPENQWTRKEPVTLRRLLSHTAGVTVHSFRGYAADEPIPTLKQILDGAKPANSARILVDSAVGGSYRYSGGGYTILQQLLVDVLNRPFPEIMRRTVFEPLGMDRSAYSQPLPESVADQAASGHRPNGSAVPGRWQTYPEMAAAGLWTTPADLAGFAVEIMLAKKGESDRLLSKPIVDQMLTPIKDFMGLGLFVEGEGQDLRFFHSGGNEGFRCYLTAFAERGQGVVIMTNGDLGGDLIGEILRSLSTEYEWPAYRPSERTAVSIPAQQLAALAGVYQFAPADRLTVSAEDGGLFVEPVYIHPTGKGRCEFFAESKATFFSTQTDAMLIFSRDSRGRVTGLTLKQGNSRRKAIKLRG
jgi:CubicO group peptidase (beta-lactamase class C family)